MGGHTEGTSHRRNVPQNGTSPQEEGPTEAFFPSTHALWAAALLSSTGESNSVVTQHTYIVLVAGEKQDCHL